MESAGRTELELTQKSDHATYWDMQGTLHNQTHEETVHVAYLHPKEWNGRTLIWPTTQGLSGLWDAEGKLTEAIKKALENGCTVLGMDLKGQGPSPLPANKIVDNGRAFAGYTYGYNHPLFAQRVHDLLSVIAHVKHHPDRPSKSVELVGIAGTGHWVAAARALAHEVIDRSTIDPSGFRFVQLKDYRSSDFLHGAVKYGDLPAMLALGTPSLLNLVVDHKEDMAMVSDLHASAGFPERLRQIKSEELTKAILHP